MMPMRDTHGNEVTDPEEMSSYTRNFEVLGESIFDAAALGQHLMGIDHPRGQWTTGHISPDAVYRVGGWTITWQMETYKGVSSWARSFVRNPTEPRELWQVHRINNLHVHHKNLGYQRALPDGPDIPANSLVFLPTSESGAQRGPWVERWNDQTNEFRSRVAAGENFSRTILQISSEVLMRQHLPLVPLNRSWSYPLLSGDSLRLIADYGREGVGEGRYDEAAAYFSRLDTTSFKPGTVVWVPSDHLSAFFSRPSPTVPYILISGNSDDGPTPEMARYLEEKSCLRLWIAQNPTFTHPRLQPLPIGFMNQQYQEGNLARLLSEAQLAHGPVGPDPEGVPLDVSSPSAERPQSQRDILLYVNLGGTTSDRALWIDVVTAWGRYRPDVRIVHERLSFEQYMNDLRRSRYVLSPPGHGLDYHRTWETLLMGAIPIVEHSPMDSLSVHHPVLLVDGPEDVTLELLERWEPLSWTRHSMWSNTWYDRIVRAKEECMLEWIAKR
ncbi:hypothetical protein JCM24511_10207 [Saitozyma sp. JCM 24511]|nr:hypothetical protein JCM24511_10207 [Saitozyma sp. JCM 24511]